MNKKVKVFLFLFVVFAAYLYVFEYSKIHEERRLKKVYPAAADEIHNIVIKNAYDVISLLRQDGRWQLKGTSLAADSFVVKSITEYFAENEVLRVLEDVNPDFDKKMKFAKPSIEIKVNDNYQLLFSSVLSYDKQIYAKRIFDGKITYVMLPQDSTSHFDKNFFYYRNKTMLKSELKGANLIHLYINNNKVYSLEKQGEQWLYNERPVDTKMVNTFLYNLKSVKAVGIKDQVKKADLADVLLDLEDYIEVHGDKKSQRFYFSILDKEKVAIYYDLKLYEFFRSHVDFLRWRLDDFLDRKKPFRIDPHKVQRIVWQPKSIIRQKIAQHWPDFSYNHFLRAWLGVEVLRYKDSPMNWQADQSLVLELEENGAIQLAWRASDLEQDKIYMTSSLSSETFVVDALSWKKVLGAIQGDISETH